MNVNREDTNSHGNSTYGRQAGTLCETHAICAWYQLVVYYLSCTFWVCLVVSSIKVLPTCHMHLLGFACLL